MVAPPHPGPAVFDPSISGREMPLFLLDRWQKSHGAERANDLYPSRTGTRRDACPDSRAETCSTLPCVTCTRPCVAGPGLDPSLLSTGQGYCTPLPRLLPGLKCLCDNVWRERVTHFPSVSGKKEKEIEIQITYLVISDRPRSPLSCSFHICRWQCGAACPPRAALCCEAQGTGGEQDGPSKYPPGGPALWGPKELMTKLAEVKEGTHGALGEHRAG